MTRRQVSTENVLAALDKARAVQFQSCRAAIDRDPRDHFTIADIQAKMLRHNLTPKHEIARQRGKLLRGSVELIDTLAALGDTLVCAVSTDALGEHVVVYFESDTMSAIGCVVVTGGARSSGSSDARDA